MIIYNVTTKVDWSVHDQWLEWMRQEHMAAVVATGCFEKYQLARLLEVDDTEGPTYTAQYFAPSRAQYHRYLEVHAPKLRQESISKWGDRVIGFRSLMQVVH